MSTHPNTSSKLMFIFRVFVLIMVYFGAITSVPLIWNMADLFMGGMAIINLFAIVLLTPFFLMLLKDYRSQLNTLLRESANEVKTTIEKIGYIQKLKVNTSI